MQSMSKMEISIGQNKKIKNRNKKMKVMRKIKNKRAKNKVVKKLSKINNQNNS